MSPHHIVGNLPKGLFALLFTVFLLKRTHRTMTYFENLPTEVLDAIGIAGFGLYVLNYSLLTFQRVQSHQICFFALNGLAAMMVLIGLISAFNLAAALIQIFWIVISIVAIFVRWRKPAASAFNGLASDQYPNRAAVR